MLTLLLKALWLGGTDFMSMGHKLTLSLKVLWLGKTLYLLGLIL